MITTLNKAEYAVITEVLKRMEATKLQDFESYEIFRFSTLLTDGFLIELPKIVSLLALHKKEFDFDGFIKSLEQVTTVITEINNWKFCFASIQDLLDSIYEGKEKGGEA